MKQIKQDDVPSSGDDYLGVVSVNMPVPHLTELAEKCKVDTSRYRPIGLDLFYTKEEREISKHMEFLCEDVQSKDQLVAIEGECEKEDLYEALLGFQIRFTIDGNVPTDEELGKNS